MSKKVRLIENYGELFCPVCNGAIKCDDCGDMPYICMVCNEAIECDDCGDMPDICPGCGSVIDWDDWDIPDPRGGAKMGGEETR